MLIFGFSFSKIQNKLTHQNRRVSDAYEKTGFPESFAKHNDAYKNE